MGCPVSDKTDQTDQTSAATPAEKPATAPPGTGDESTAARDAKPGRSRRRTLPAVGLGVKTVRTALARVLWTVCVLAAAVLAAAVLLIAIDANVDNDLVRFLIDAADKVDLGFFDLTDPVKDFDTAIVDPTQDVKTALFNYGICAIVWLVVGRIADRLVRP